MSTFKTGWYSIRKQADGTRQCLYFRSQEYYTARCTVASNGQQFLLWQDPGGPEGQGLPGRWLASYEHLPNAPAGDWWDNASSGAGYKPANPGDFSRNARKPTAKELSQRACAADAAQASGLSCTKEIHVGVFFDGTNNNMDRDRPEKGHSNVVSLYDAHKEDKIEFLGTIYLASALASPKLVSTLSRTAVAIRLPKAVRLGFIMACCRFLMPLAPRQRATTYSPKRK